MRKSNLKILVLTNFHKIFLENLDIPENKIKVFPNYIEAFDKTDINNDKNFILYAGRISEEKGVEELIKQYLKLSEPIFSLRIAGEGPLLKNLMEQYKRQMKLRKVFNGMQRNIVLKNTQEYTILMI